MNEFNDLSILDEIDRHLSDNLQLSTTITSIAGVCTFDVNPVLNHQGFILDVIIPELWDTEGEYRHRKYSHMFADKPYFYLSTLAINPIALIEHASDNSSEMQYLWGALQTWNMKYPAHLQVSNAVHGLIGELSEVILEVTLENDKSAVVDELGDVLYYRQVLRYLMGDDLDYSTEDLNDDSFFEMVKLLSDIGKKISFHDRIGVEKTMKRYQKGISIADSFIQKIIFNNELDIEEVQRLNLNKLLNRHGSSFSPEY